LLRLASQQGPTNNQWDLRAGGSSHCLVATSTDRDLGRMRVFAAWATGFDFPLGSFSAFVYFQELWV